jgi:NAD(P)-dependent dehydrogenase (short-subunit alcohol dehydrogenase family)
VFGRHEEVANQDGCGDDQQNGHTEEDAMRLADKVVIVTGGGRGIGRAYSLGLAAEGARVVVAADITDPAPAVKEIEARGGQALGVHCDVAREHDALELATKTLARFGRIDVLVNNASIYGTLKRRPFMEIPVEEWDQVMAVNLRGLFLCARAVFPAMKAQGKGKIINIASSGFFNGVPNYIPTRRRRAEWSDSRGRSPANWGISASA